MKKLKLSFTPARILGLAGFIALAMGTILNVVLGANFPNSLIPYTNVVTPIVNGLCTLLCLIFIFFPKRTEFLLVILSIQSIYDVLTGFELLGLFHFLLINLILFCNEFYKTKAKRKVLSIFFAWFLLLATLLSFGLDRFIFAFVVTLFMTSAFMYIYYLLCNQLSCLLPNEIQSSKFDIPLPGSILDLSGLGLTERQLACILACKDNSLSYKQLGEQFFVSESAIKKEMASLFEKFGVKNKEQLRILLNHYQIKQ